MAGRTFGSRGAYMMDSSYERIISLGDCASQFQSSGSKNSCQLAIAHGGLHPSGRSRLMAVASGAVLLVVITDRRWSVYKY
jgi:hypothetical protein